MTTTLPQFVPTIRQRLLAAALALSLFAAAPGRCADWNGYELLNFKVENRNALLVKTRYKELGGDITVIKKPKAGHPPAQSP